MQGFLSTSTNVVQKIHCFFPIFIELLKWSIPGLYPLFSSIH